MIGLTPRQREVLAYVSGRELCPSLEEISSALGMKARSTALYILRGLEERGYIRRLPNRARAIEVLRRLPPSPIIINGERYRFIPLERAEG